MFNFWHILFPFSYYLTGNFHTRFTLLVNNYSIRWLHCCGTDAEGNKMTMQLKNKAGAAGIQPPPLRIVMIIIIVIINWATVPDEYKTVLSVSHVVTRTECCCLTSNFLWTQQTPPWHCLCMCCWNWFGATMCNEMGINSFLATCERYYPYDFVWAVRTNKYLNVYVCKIFNLNLRIFLFILQTLVRKEAYFIKVESTITQEKKIISLKIFFVNYKNFLNYGNPNW